MSWFFKNVLQKMAL